MAAASRRRPPSHIVALPQPDLTPTNPADDPSAPLDLEIKALHRVLGELASVADIEKRAGLVARVATAGIQAARARHAIDGGHDIREVLLAWIETLYTETPTDESAGAPARETSLDRGV